MKSFLEPESVALIGVPRQSGPGSYNNLEAMLRYGFEGKIFVIHPKTSEICGYKTYSRIEELPVVPELVIISIGRDRVLPVFQECIQKGVKNFIIISQGFADADEQGQELQKDLVKIARENKVKVMGPNTMGTLNAFSGFSSAFVDIPRDPSPPPLSLIAQSGIFQVGFESFTDRLGKAIDLGNCSDLDFVDALNFLEEDPQTKIIVIHMEGLKRGRTFLKTASRVSRQKPILVLKTGRSSEGARAALSHTGSMVGEDSVFDKAFEKAGIIRVKNVIELLAASRAFLNFQPMSGPRIAIITAAGATGIISADACQDYGLNLAPFPEEIGKQLESPQIYWHKLRNPVDIWPLGMVSGSFTEVFKNAARLLLKEKEVDAVLGIVPSLKSPLHTDLDMVSCLYQIQKDNVQSKPIAICGYGSGSGQLRTDLEKIPNTSFFPSIDQAIMGLSATWRYSQNVARQVKDQDLEEPQIKTKDNRVTKPPSENLLLGDEAFDLLRAYNIPVVQGGVVEDISSAVTLAEKIGYPVTLKILSPKWLHKSDLGGVMLNLRNMAELKEAFSQLSDCFQQQTPEAIFSGILVQRYLQGTELIFGIKKDPQFGPVVLAGLGGIYTEIFKDISKEIIPVMQSEADKMLYSLKCYPLLKGTRGQPGTDLDQLKKIILSLSQLAIDYPDIEELDLNPVLANEQGAWCVDSRIIFE